MNTLRTWGFSWFVAFIAFPPAGLLAVTVINRLDTPLSGLIGGAVVGAIVGLAQMLALSRRLALGWGWVIASAIGLGLGTAASVAIFGSETTVDAIVQRAPVAGLGLGIAQALILRHHIGRHAIAWAVAVALIFPLAWFVTALVITTSVNQGFVIFGASGAIVFQVLTGLVLWVLLRGKAASER